MNKSQLTARITELEAENAKVRRINHALIERVESGQAHNNNPYAAFEHSVILAEQVRDRTEALNNALSELKISHQALRQANNQAATAHQLLNDAVESISDAFVLFDSQNRIVMYNQKFHRVWLDSGIEIATGTTVEDLNRLAIEHHIIARPQPGSDQDTRVFQLHDGRWIQMSERPTSDNGLVVLYTDITALKAQETQVREQALARKTHQLQRTLENLSQAVVLINPLGELELWNTRFNELTQLSNQQLRQFSHISQLQDHDKSGLRHMPARLNSKENQQITCELADGRVVEVHTHTMPEGGLLNTYSDITDRHLHAEALRQSEHWIRLITDHVPALIAYVDESLTFDFTNQVYNEWYGWSRDALKGMSIIEAHGATQFAHLSPYIERALQGERVTFEIEEQNAQGKTCFMLKSYVPNLDDQQKVIGFFVLIQDITESRQTAEELKKAYQLMEQRVNDRTSELVSLNAQLLSEIDERRAIEHRLREAHQYAEQANLSKTKFLAAVSHDLLQPLNAARLFTGALIDQPLAEKPQHLAKSLSHSLEDVESLLGTLVDISKLDAGVVEPDISVFPVNELLENLANEYRQVAETEKLSFSFHSSRLAIRTDSQLLARILRNFLTNAIRYTGKGKVVLGVRQRKNALCIQVWDTGVGIPQEKLSEIFQEFRRLAGPYARQDKALGLGLAIVEKISRVLDHPISVRSQEGKGSVFEVQVPCAHYTPPPSNTSAITNNANLKLQGAQIWVIDNDLSICNAMEQLLTSWGCQITTALSLEDLLHKTDQASQPCDLIIADYHLDNDENGVDAASHILSLRAEKTSVLMITANHCQDLKQQIRQKGFLMINKPVKPLKLKTLISHLLN